MKIESVTEMDGHIYKVVIDGITMCVPDDMKNPYRRAIQKWIDAGNVPEVAPVIVKPPLSEEIDKRREGDPVMDDIFKRLTALETK